MNAKQAILEQIQNGALKLCTLDEIARALHLKRREALAAKSMLASLCRAGELLCDMKGRFGTTEQFGAKKGVYTGNERGFGFFTSEDGSGDLFIPHRASLGALHGDVVLACPSKGRSDDEGEVLYVLERGLKKVVGTFRLEGRGGFLEPDDSRYTARVYIPSSKRGKVQNGSKAVAKIVSFENGQPFGEIEEVLGKSGDLFTEELSIIRAHAFREEFPEDVLKEADKVASKGISSEELSRREDLRGELIITVDGEDTRDIDDAISLTKKDGKYFLGVHIADVTHYVRRAGALDKEAFLRGTSVYFPDRVLPMLPKALSNGICSLNENEDRLTLSCLMTVDGSGKVLEKRIAPTVIRSRHRMTYTNVMKLYEGDKETVEKYPDLVGLVRDTMELTKILQRRRRESGCVELDLKEAKILYENGTIDIPEAPRTIAHEMIEQFMVLANESVAEIMTQKKAPFVYRVHESPSPEKVHDLQLFLTGLGMKKELNEEHVTPKDFQKILTETDGTPLSAVLSRVMLRAMMKAKYSPENVGHFGLASACYCHFTSPIRRYPDLAIHRIIKDSLRGEGGNALKEKYGTFVEDASFRSSATERTAQEGERDVDDLYIAFYMKDKIGEEYEATISGVTSFGVFAELANTVEGMIPVETLPEDRYEFLEEQRLLKGAKQSFRLGGKLFIKVAGVDLGARRVIFSLIKSKEETHEDRRR